MHRRDLLGLSALAPALALTGCQRLCHPTDQNLIVNFLEKQTSFERLIEFAREEPTIRRIAPDFCRAETGVSYDYPSTPVGFSADRWNLFRRLFQELGLDLGIEFWDRNKIRLIASGKNRSGKGYVWSFAPVAPVVERLDGLVLSVGSEMNGDFRAYRSIRQLWYLFYEEYRW